MHVSHNVRRARNDPDMCIHAPAVVEGVLECNAPAIWGRRALRPTPCCGWKELIQDVAGYGTSSARWGLRPRNHSNKASQRNELKSSFNVPRPSQNPKSALPMFAVCRQARQMSPQAGTSAADIFRARCRANRPIESGDRQELGRRAEQVEESPSSSSACGPRKPAGAKLATPTESSKSHICATGDRTTCRPNRRRCIQKSGQSEGGALQR